MAIVAGDGFLYSVCLSNGFSKKKTRLTIPPEGLLTCVVAFAFFFVISDFPEEAKWLTAEERQFVKARLQEDVGGSQRHKPLTVKGVFSILKECQLYRSDSKNNPDAMSQGTSSLVASCTSVSSYPLMVMVNPALWFV